MYRKRNLLLIASLIVCTSYASLHLVENDETVPYPDGYRKWTHISSAVIGPSSPAFSRFGGVHHIYANDKAMKGFEMEEFPEGSVFVFDLLAMVEEQGTIKGGARKFIDVMVKDSNRYDSTGGWGYQEFKGDTKEINIGNLERQTCFNCHVRQKKMDYVFSKFRP
jgi:hypothetical protein